MPTRVDSCSDFETDFSAQFDVPLKPVEVVQDITPAEFETTYRRPGVPVVIDGVASKWPAATLWKDPAHLIARSGDRVIYVRDLDAGSTNFEDYREAYEEVRFSDFVSSVTRANPKAWYLTQGSLTKAVGRNAALTRKTFPAWLPELAQDLEVPRYWDRNALCETNLWMGPGNQISALHFDEWDNINAIVSGSKRWLLFPVSETPNLLQHGGSGRSSLIRGFHQTENARFSHPDRRRARGYQCVTKPGQMLFVPSGMWHQVFSGPEFNTAINFWFMRIPGDLRRCCRVHARRHAGFKSRKRYGAALTAVYAQVGLRLAMHGLGVGGKEDVVVGPTAYD